MPWIPWHVDSVEGGTCRAIDYALQIANGLAEVSGAAHSPPLHSVSAERQFQDSSARNARQCRGFRGTLIPWKGVLDQDLPIAVAQRFRSM
jgi:hypothetical protein